MRAELPVGFGLGVELDVVLRSGKEDISESKKLSSMPTE